MKNLKKLTLLMLGSFVAITNVNAQNNDKDAESRIRLGIKAGINYSNIYDEDGDDYVADGKLGFAGGAFISVPFGKILGIQPEFLISQKGFQATGSVLGMNYELTRTTTFVDIPLFFALRPLPMFTLLAGPQLSFLVNQKDEFTSSIVSYEVEQEFENDNIRKNILCFVGGFDINIKPVVVSARAGFDFQSNKGDGTSTTPRYKNVWLQATVGLRF